MKTEEPIIKGPEFTFRRDGSGCIKFDSMAQLALLDAGQAIQFAQEAQRQFREADLLETAENWRDFFAALRVAEPHEVASRRPAAESPKEPKT